ncbi:DNA translocase FtsK [bacterium]|nr:DNA translocase FtsK [bacterium]
MSVKKNNKKVEHSAMGMRPSQKNEIIGIVNISISMLLIVAYVFRAGVVMQYIASGIEKVFGLGIYIISAWLFIGGIEKIKGKKIHTSRYEILGWLMLFVSFMIFMSVIFSPDLSAGGIIGTFGFKYFTLFFGKVGSIIFLVTLLLVSFILAFDITFTDIINYLKKIVEDIVTFIKWIVLGICKITVLLFSPVGKFLNVIKQKVIAITSGIQKSRLENKEKKAAESAEKKAVEIDDVNLSRINITVDGVSIQDKKEKNIEPESFGNKLKDSTTDDFKEKYVEFDENEYVHTDDLEEYKKDNVPGTRKTLEVKGKEKEKVKVNSKKTAEKKKDTKKGFDIKIAASNNDIEKKKVNVVIRDKSFLPKVEFLEKPKSVDMTGIKKELAEKADIVIKTLGEFNIPSKILGIVVGPSVTRIEITIAAGIKVSKVKGLSEDIGLKLATKSIRIEAPIPGKSSIGIEIPNTIKVPVFIREIIDTDITTVFDNSESLLTMAFGKTISGEPRVGNLAKMPHLLVAGATGSGKSVCINSIIVSFLYKATSDQLKMLMIDPKMVELAVYDKIPHLLHPVVTDPMEAATLLNWAVQEMERRYQILSKLGVRQLDQYNKLIDDYDSGKVTSSELPLDDDGNCYFDLNYPEKMPPIVLIIDELADLMMVAKNAVEDSICRLLQKSRAIGIHLIIATQRPSVDVITGLLKANLPSRIAFKVSSGIDSRTILDRTGAEGLLGWGDMLYSPTGSPAPERLQGCFVDDKEIKRIVDFLKAKDNVEYDSSISNYVSSSKVAAEQSGSSGRKSSDGDGGSDELFPKALTVVMDTNYGSTSMIQRKLKVGYARAGRLMDILEDRGIIGPRNGSKPRDILISREEADEIIENYENE